MTIKKILLHGSKQHFWFKTVSSNGTVITVSDEPYLRKSDCKRAAAAYAKAFLEPPIVLDQTEPTDSYE